jgi:putative ABC transport system substrate-binding protein
VKRREFIAGLGGAAATWPLAGRAQQHGGVRRVAIIFGGFGPNDPELQARVKALKDGMQEHGWIEGRNVAYDLSIGGGDAERLQAQVRELIDKSPDVIASNSSAAMRALLGQTQTIPIVSMNVTDLVAAGVIPSLARPGGNVTGFTSFEPSIVGKWLELLDEVAPATSRIAVIFDPANARFWRAAEATATGKKMIAIAVATRSELEREVELFAREPGGALVFLPSTVSTANRDLIFRLSSQYQLPTIFGFHYFTKEGGLMSYGIDVVDNFRRAASYVDRILRGARPSDLPMQQPTKFQLVINLKTAKALGLTIPSKLLFTADEVIE